MSQTTLLEEVITWSQDACRKELTYVLPKLIAIQHESWDEHIRVLKIITDKFLPHIGPSELEDECFSKILPKVVKVFDGLMEEIANQVGVLSSQTTEPRACLRNALQVTVQVLEVLSACVRHVCSLEDAPSLGAIRSLPSCILRVLKDTFQHCKDSELVYRGSLSVVADLLQAMFKEAYSLQKGLIELLDRVSLESTASENDVSDIITVIDGLLDICSVISNLDIALHANTWKCIVKQSVKHQALVEERLPHGALSSRLGDDLLTSLLSCLDLAEQTTHTGPQVKAQCPEYKLFQKNTKMCRFFSNTLVHYIKEFKPFLAKYCGHFHQIYLKVLSKFPPSLSAVALPSPLSEELNAAALVPMEALLCQLLPFRPFAEVVLAQHLQLGPELELPHCLLLVSVLGQLSSQPEEALELWHSGSQFSEDTPRLPLYRAVFQSFQRCYMERCVPVLLPGVMLKGQAQGKVTLHHHVCVFLCASVAALPPQQLPLLERSLLEAVLLPDTQTALLASDLWCFLARYGTAELCLRHVLVLADLVKVCPTGCYQLSHLALLLRRMVFLMTPSHQLELVERYPASQVENLAVWSHVLLRALSPEARRRVGAGVVALTHTTLTAWQHGGHRLGDMDKVNVALSSLLAVLRCDSVEAECVSSAVRIVSQLWPRICPRQVQAQPVLRCTLRLLLSMSAILVRSIEPQLICQALVCVGALVSQKPPDDVVLAALEFLASLGKVFIPMESQSQVLPRVSGLFGALLAERSWLVHQHALEAFAHFAEITNHEEVISQSLATEETKNKVVNFLSKTVKAQEALETRLERLKLETPVIRQHNERLESSEETVGHEPAAAVRDDDDDKETVDSEPCSKRARQDDGAEDYERYVQTAEGALRALLNLARGGTDPPAPPPPAWLPARLQDLVTLITQIRTTESQES